MALSFTQAPHAMIRDQETLNVLLDNIARFVRERLVPNEELVAETDEIPDGHRRRHEGHGSVRPDHSRSASAAWS